QVTHCASERSPEVHRFAVLQLGVQRRIAGNRDDRAAAPLQRTLPFVADALGAKSLLRPDEQHGRRGIERVLEVALPVVAWLEILDIHPCLHSASQQVKRERFGEVIIPSRIADEYWRCGG